jgi:hypothetical protein
MIKRNHKIPLSAGWSAMRFWTLHLSFANFGKLGEREN